MNKVISYYTENYDEDYRLGENCDNRHIVEREVKKHILSKYLKKGAKILEIGAGTGLYSISFAKEGYEVNACDIVPKHVKIIKEKAKKLNLKIETTVADALSLPYENEEFDLVLLSGPIYHFSEYNDKEISIKEAARVCKKSGVVVVDYLSEIHGFIQHSLLSAEFLKKSKIEDIMQYNCKDEMFSYDNRNRITNLMNTSGLEEVKVYGTDSITRFIREDINKLDKETLSQWIRFILSISDNEGVTELSEHCIAIGIKS